MILRFQPRLRDAARMQAASFPLGARFCSNPRLITEGTSAMTQPLYTVRQLAYVVRDMDAALKYWVDVLHVGPFFVFEHCPLLNQRYYGKPSNVDVTLALGNSGALQIELIYQHNDEPSVYKEFLDAGRVGVHHFGMMPQD